MKPLRYYEIIYEGRHIGIVIDVSKARAYERVEKHLREVYPAAPGMDLSTLVLMPYRHPRGGRLNG